MTKRISQAVIGVEDVDKNGYIVGVNVIADKNTLKAVISGDDFSKEDAILLAGAVNYRHVSIPELAALLTYLTKYVTAATQAEKDAVKPLLDNALMAVLARSTNEVDEAALAQLVTSAQTADDVISAL